MSEQDIGYALVDPMCLFASYTLPPAQATSSLLPRCTGQLAGSLLNVTLPCMAFHKKAQNARSQLACSLYSSAAQHVEYQWQLLFVDRVCYQAQHTTCSDHVA